MARAALAVVYAHERDDEIAALRARVVELERSREDLCWWDRVRQVEEDCQYTNNDEYALDRVFDLLIWPIEDQRWGIREGVVTVDVDDSDDEAGEVPAGVALQPGRLAFRRRGGDRHHFESNLMSSLACALQFHAIQTIEWHIRRVESVLRLPRGSCVRLPADAEFRD